MSVTLTPQVEHQIRRLVESGRYADADAVVRDALRLLEEHDRTRALKLREMVRAGFESGDEVELTSELWDELVREAEEEERHGVPIRDEVRP